MPFFSNFNIDKALTQFGKKYKVPFNIQKKSKKQRINSHKHKRESMMVNSVMIHLSSLNVPTSVNQLILY